MPKRNFRRNTEDGLYSVKQQWLVTTQNLGFVYLWQPFTKFGWSSPGAHESQRNNFWESRISVYLKEFTDVGANGVIKTYV